MAVTDKGAKLLDREGENDYSIENYISAKLMRKSKGAYRASGDHAGTVSASVKPTKGS